MAHSTGIDSSDRSPRVAEAAAVPSWVVGLDVLAKVVLLVAMARVAVEPEWGNLEGKAPDEVQWKSHNYTHLLEQPTIFYAIVLALALMEMNQPINIYLAWGYVGLRIVHSLVQCLTNVVKYRFPVFALASLCLLGLTVHAAARILHDCGII